MSSNPSALDFRLCTSEQDYQFAREITRAYADWLAMDLGFQGFDKEIGEFDRMYGPPQGLYLLATLNGEIAGGVGLRYFEPGICEMKRLYVYPAFSGHGIGIKLCQELITHATQLGYTQMRLDTMARLATAIYLYQKLGFVDIPPYRFNPDPETRYMALDLTDLTPTQA